MLKRWFAGKRERTPAEAAVPADRLVYAIGDIHGRLDLLQRLQEMIFEDAARAAASDKVIVYLGDYVDRGEQSREVLDLLLDAPLPGFDCVHLLGNHEQFLLSFTRSLQGARLWFYNGGDATLQSYGIKPPLVRDDEDLADVRETFFSVFPERHLKFLQELRLSHEEGDYFFAHAGVRPRVPLDRQTPDDLVWIRDEFLGSDEDFGKIVVHGHTIARDVEMRANRIGIDTGAYASGKLSCLVLQGTGRWLLQT